MKRKTSSTHCKPILYLASRRSVWENLDRGRKFKFLLFYIVYRKLKNIVYRNAEIKNTNKLAREKQYLIMYSDQSSQRAFELATVMCR